MSLLNKELTLFQRDEKGNLLPQEVDLVVDETSPSYEELKDAKIMIIPMTRGEIKKFFSALDASDASERDLDEELILKYCVNPSYSEHEVKFLKSDYSSPIVATILQHSGLDSKKGKKKAMLKAEDDFAKN